LTLSLSRASSNRTYPYIHTLNSSNSINNDKIPYSPPI
jgi:hypothetical protein